MAAPIDTTISDNEISNAVTNSTCDCQQQPDSKLPLSPSTVHVTTVRNNNLNINRALRRKLNVFAMVQVDYNVTGGGTCITGTLDTASFELFRLSCTSFYTELSTQEGRRVLVQ